MTRFCFRINIRKLVAVAAVFCMPASPALAQGEYKMLPPKGIDVAAEELRELADAVAKARAELESAAASEDGSAWRPDVEVFLRSAELAIDQGLFYKPKDTDGVRQVVRVARERLEVLKTFGGGINNRLLAVGAREEKDAAAPRLLAGGFVSRIDGSTQPYGLVVPADYFENPDKPRRLDVWLHGRGDTKTEIPFLQERLSRVGIYAPDDTIVLHPFGRHCNAFKFAGEVDVDEAIEHVKERFSIDPLRVSIRGFSMGGAGCWHLAAHAPGRWFAANPGAGFVDTIRYQGWDRKGIPFELQDWGRRLMYWYDIPPWVDNLSNTNVIAYSGEVDPQRQAAELMIEAAEKQNIEIEHVIGAGMGHKIDDDSAAKIEARMAHWADQATDEYRSRIRLVTYTLRYPQVDWVRVEGLKEHWKRAEVTAELVEPATIRIDAANVDRLRLDFSRRGWPLHSGSVRLEINGQMAAGPSVTAGRPLAIDLIEQDGQWYELDRDDEADVGLRKKPGLQGPIDDALTGPFLFVMPSRPCRHGNIERFVEQESEHARRTWQRVMRGDVRTVLDSELTEEQIASHHLICFGDFTGNRFLASIAGSLPLRWTDEQITAGAESFESEHHALVMVYPNPKNPEKYVVVNSGVTFRESSNTTNSRQIAMLPDWAVIDVRVAPDGVFPGKVAAADFFDESWTVRKGE